jgi:hypothetical protein
MKELLKSSSYTAEAMEWSGCLVILQVCSAAHKIKFPNRDILTSATVCDNNKSKAADLMLTFVAQQTKFKYKKFLRKIHVSELGSCLQFRYPKGRIRPFSPNIFHCSIFLDAVFSK